MNVNYMHKEIDKLRKMNTGHDFLNEYSKQYS